MRAALALLALASMAAPDPTPAPGPQAPSDGPDPEHPDTVLEEVRALAGMLSENVPGCEGTLHELPDGSGWEVGLYKPSGENLAKCTASTPRDAMSGLLQALMAAGGDTTTADDVHASGKRCPICGRGGRGRYCTGHGHHARLVGV